MQRIVLFLIFILILVTFGISFALDPSPQGLLDVKVVASGSPRYISDWVKKSSEEPIFVNAIKEVKPEQTFFVAFIVSGFGISEQGSMDIEADLILKSPDGEVGFEQKNACRAKGPVSVSHTFVMLDPALDLTLQKENSPGVYVVKAVVKDNVLNKTAIGEYEIKLIGNSNEDSAATGEGTIKSFAEAAPQIKNYKEAEEHYQKAVEYMNQRDADNGIFHLEKAIELGFLDKSPSSGGIYAMLAGMYQAKRSVSEAKKYYSLALDSFHKELAEYEKNNNFEKASTIRELIVKTEQRVKSLENMY